MQITIDYRGIEEGATLTDFVRCAVQVEPDRGLTTEEGRRCFAELYSALVRYEDAVQKSHEANTSKQESKRPWVSGTDAELKSALKSREEAFWAGYAGVAINWAEQCRHLATSARAKQASDEQLAAIRACWEVLSNPSANVRNTVTARIKSALEATEGNYHACVELVNAMRACHIQADLARSMCGISGFAPEGAHDAIVQIIEGESSNRQSGFCIAPDPARIAHIVDDVARWA